MYYYETGPIDYFAGTISLDVFKEQIKKEVDKFQSPETIFNAALENLESAKIFMRTNANWEGDIITGPFVFAVPSPDKYEMEVGFVWKQSNNGTTFIASPFGLSWLEEYRVKEKE